MMNKIYYMNTSTAESLFNEIQNEERFVESIPVDVYREISSDINIDFNILRTKIVDDIDSYVDKKFDRREAQTRKITREDMKKMFHDILEYGITVTTAKPQYLTLERAYQLIHKYLRICLLNQISSDTIMYYGGLSEISHNIIKNKI